MEENLTAPDPRDDESSAAAPDGTEVSPFDTPASSEPAEEAAPATSYSIYAPVDPEAQVDPEAWIDPEAWPPSDTPAEYMDDDPEGLVAPWNPDLEYPLVDESAPEPLQFEEVALDAPVQGAPELHEPEAPAPPDREDDLLNAPHVPDTLDEAAAPATPFAGAVAEVPPFIVAEPDVPEAVEPVDAPPASEPPALEAPAAEPPVSETAPATEVAEPPLAPVVEPVVEPAIEPAPQPEAQPEPPAAPVASAEEPAPAPQPELPTAPEAAPAAVTPPSAPPVVPIPLAQPAPSTEAAKPAPASATTEKADAPPRTRTFFGRKRKDAYALESSSSAVPPELTLLDAAGTVAAQPAAARPTAGAAATRTPLTSPRRASRPAATTPAPSAPAAVASAAQVAPAQVAPTQDEAKVESASDAATPALSLPVDAIRDEPAPATPAAAESLPTPVTPATPARPEATAPDEDAPAQEEPRLVSRAVAEPVRPEPLRPEPVQPAPTPVAPYDPEGLFGPSTPGSAVDPEAPPAPADAESAETAIGPSTPIAPADSTAPIGPPTPVAVPISSAAAANAPRSPLGAPQPVRTTPRTRSPLGTSRPVRTAAPAAATLAFAPKSPAAPAPRREGRIDVINPEGWRREFPLRRAILYVGSAPGSDIQLNHATIAPRHLQFVPSSANRVGYRMINLSGDPISVRSQGAAEAREVAARGSLELGDGDRVEIAGYALVFATGEVSSQVIQASVEMPRTRLELDRPLDGVLLIRNGGERAGVQFVVEVQGIDARFIQVEPGPVLFPGGEKQVAFRITHPRMSMPAAGDQPINFVVTAPEGYPGETAVVSQMISVAPFFAHKVRLLALEPELAGYSLSSGR